MFSLNANYGMSCNLQCNFGQKYKRKEEKQRDRVNM